LSREALLVRRTLITISPRILKSATTTKIEKKTPNILAGLFSQRFQDKLLVPKKQKPRAIFSPGHEPVKFQNDCRQLLLKSRLLEEAPLA
jgi:hypothetical protein